LCKDAVAAPGTDDADVNNLPAAMNQSIYLMISVPYLLLGVVCFLVYRGLRKNAEYLRSLQQPASAVGQPQT
jgi:hypothetical protein